ncbi:MAG: small subunit ribosomal protein S17 [Parcubacteria group bacterium Greene0416_79]|nr:MAG: small subunit ribosomal protein S17 [Parcubacteria group bacterium Greene0416_79]
MTGAVVSTKMKDTVTVEITRFVRHPRYRKYLRVTRRIKAHDAGNTKKEGERVTIIECRPISRDKHFTVV